MPGLFRTIGGTTSMTAAASLKYKEAGILSATLGLVVNQQRGVFDFLLNITQNACNLATIKLRSLNPTQSRLTASFGKQVKGITNANIHQWAFG
ncbi:MULTISPECIES: hypothetical protein [unclassified Paenibacillus]|uniref:hypothetical protein n=1 Tax=unclassified Paenibacillus TaxID=185978 RepID=UPI0027838E1A|nr:MULTISPECIES: hypothetical protein [unclassified Paenibacillus]MDQ0899202.1 hypothetical protein [Paenibacillus sp. V4I7]MDQ0914808.1 hypothetical protein [Paenibacillus sp. V4I5]